ncbi:MAG: N-acetylmuramoyl-L-alanine amidase [Bacteroidetes bacterium]|nr:N-acetylmuramoyl-L-alanine amidase [Bacteroidota bacterium]
MFRSFIILLLFTSSIIAQVRIDAFQQQPAQIPAGKDSLFLRVQIPDKDTIRTFSSRLRYAACTSPDAAAFVNGNQSKVYSSGAFVGLITIETGINNFRFLAVSTAGDSLYQDFVIIRPEPMKNSPIDTLVIEDAMMRPAQDMWLVEGDVLELRFKGSPGWEATCEIPGIEPDITMHEQSPAEADGFSGVYVGNYTVQPNDEIYDVQVIFKLKKSFWNSEKRESKAKVSFFKRKIIHVAEVIGSRVYLNTGLGTDRLGGSKLGFLQTGVRLEITGKTGPQYRIRLSETMDAWLPEEYAKLLPPDTPRPRSLAGAISVSGNKSEDIIKIALSEKLPYISEQTVNPNTIIVDIFGATSNTNWISQNQTARGIESITWKQVTTDQYRLTITLLHEHWGYDIEYAGNTMHIKIRRPPVPVSSSSVLGGITIAVDAGHGGDYKGAVGATGTLEKDITIIIARHLESILKSKGAKVIMTRGEDEGPYMSERIDKILRSNSQLLVSIHCNSAGESSNPLLLCGVSTYYRHIGFKQLADIIYEKMLSIGLPQFGVVGSFNFTLNSLTQVPNVLVETAFLSNPEEEMILLDDGFWKKAAEQIAAGLEEYVKSAK